VPQQILDQLGMGAGLKQDRGGGVAELVRTDPRQRGPIQCDLGSVRDGARILGQAALVLKDQLCIDALTLAFWQQPATPAAESRDSLA